MDYTIFPGYDEDHEYIIKFSEEDHAQLKELVEHEDSLHGLSLNCSCYYNSYDCDEYLYFAYLIRKIRKQYQIKNQNPYTGEWLNNTKPLPYIHLEIYEGNNPGYVNAGISRPDNQSNYTLLVDHIFLVTFIKYLQKIFDNNEETVVPCASPPGDKVNRDQIINQAHLCRNTVPELSRLYMDYAMSLSDEDMVFLPSPVFFKNADTGKQTFSGLTFYDEKQAAYVIPMKKSIYNTSAFAKYFYTRVDAICRIFDLAMEHLLTHEIAHIANGHGLLLKVDEAYAKMHDHALCLEQNADDTAIRWRIGDILFESPDGSPDSCILLYSCHDFVEELSFRVFAAYLLLSFQHGPDDRVWSQTTLDDYLSRDYLNHPIFQFRTFNTINRSLNLISEFRRLAFPPPGCTTAIKTLDNKLINENVVEATIYKITSMLESFEYALANTLDDNRTAEEILHNSWRVNPCSRPSSGQMLPFLMPVFLEGAKIENERISSLWPELRARLCEIGAYANLFQTT